VSEAPDYAPQPGRRWGPLGVMLSQLSRQLEDRIDAADVDQANLDMKRLGCRTRYRPDGTPYQLDGGGGW